ncbi:hypothetical protein BDP27DRAFT_1339188 [Rhodocollybia butyracea]|uniref:Uncharacterized protein n=1 Tax=Rhodocollybia butyracea TaxID=206335 RepID=A0A9P5PEK7_9AGAR|nr:hypothetical protein BDP27DRAFT_1339188 [Rhodocollybia butyracea]
MATLLQWHGLGAKSVLLARCHFAFLVSCGSSLFSIYTYVYTTIQWYGSGAGSALFCILVCILSPVRYRQLELALRYLHSLPPPSSTSSLVSAASSTFYVLSVPSHTQFLCYAWSLCVGDLIAVLS